MTQFKFKRRCFRALHCWCVGRWDESTSSTFSCHSVFSLIFSPSISEPKPPHPCRGAEHAQTHWYGWVDWIQFGLAELDYTDCDQNLSPFYFSHCKQYLIFFSSEASGACIILACANANGPQKLRRIYADMKGYRLVQIWLVIVSDFGGFV